MSKEIVTLDRDTVDFQRLMSRLKLMITNGKRLTDQEAAALAQFAVSEGLDPFAGEVYLLKNENKNEIIGPMVGIKGLRRKAQERLGPDDNYTLEFVLIDPPEGVLYAYECRLRDTQSMGKYLDMRIKAESMFRESGSRTPSNDAFELIGPAPIYKGLGYFFKDEQNAYKDKKYHPREKAQKRAEAAAIKRRFSLNYNVGDDGEDGVVETTGEYTSGVYIDYTEVEALPDPEPGNGHIEYPEHLTNILNSQGQRYVDLPDDKLHIMAASIKKSIPKADDDKQATYALKLDAIKEILVIRADADL